MIAMEKALPSSYRLSKEARRLLEILAQKLGISQTSVLEILLREKAKQEGVE